MRFILLFYFLRRLIDLSLDTVAQPFDVLSSFVLYLDLGEVSLAWRAMLHAIVSDVGSADLDTSVVEFVAVAVPSELAVERSTCALV